MVAEHMGASLLDCHDADHGLGATVGFVVG
jgi:hypothetical protein